MPGSFRLGKQHCHGFLTSWVPDTTWFRGGTYSATGLPLGVGTHIVTLRVKGGCAEGSLTLAVIVVAPNACEGATGHERNRRLYCVSW